MVQEIERITRQIVDQYPQYSLGAKIIQNQARYLRSTGQLPEKISEEITSIEVNGLKFDLVNRAASQNRKPIHFTYTEFNLISHLANRYGQTVSHKELIRAGWGEDISIDQDTRGYLRLYISYLRRRIRTTSDNGVSIETEHGVGYRLV